MKKIITAVALLMAGCSFSYAQCDKKVMLTSSKTEYLGADSTVQRTNEEQSEVVFDKTSITVKPGDENAMTGTVNSYTCNWTTPYKEGKLVLKATFSDGNESKNVTITITGKGGKVTFLAEVEGEQRKIRLAADKFEESKN
jgi:hypothetical protein